MATYVIGDVHGCCNALESLLDHINLKKEDEVYFIGDLVGKGNQQWEVLSLVNSLTKKKIILGNHDITFIAEKEKDKKLSVEKKRLLKMLYFSNFAIFHEATDTLCVHAGLWYTWSLEKTLSLAKEVENIFQDERERSVFFRHMYEKTPIVWKDSLNSAERFRAIVGILTRIRVLNENKEIDFSFTQGMDDLPIGYKSWFDLMSKKPCQRVVFGHWAMLRAKTNNENFINIDAGCIYGGRLVALHLEDNKYFYVNINGRVLGC